MILSVQFEDKLLKFPDLARKTLASGYMIRFLAILVYIGAIFLTVVNPMLTTVTIIPSIVTLVGVVLVVIGWFKVRTWSINKAYLLAFIGSIIVLASLILTIYSAYTLGYLTEVTLPNQTISFVEYKEQYIKTIEDMQRTMKDPINYAPMILMGIGLIMEGIGFKGLNKDTGGSIPLYIFILLLILGIIQIIIGLLNPLIADSLDSVKRDAMNAGSLLDLRSVEYKLSIALLPLVLVAIPMIIISVFTYLIVSLKMWKIKEQVEKLKMLMERSEKKREEEELLI